MASLWYFRTLMKIILWQQQDTGMLDTAIE